MAAVDLTPLLSTAVVAAMCAIGLLGLSWLGPGRRRPTLLLALAYLSFVLLTSLMFFWPQEWVLIRTALVGGLSLIGAALVLAGIRDFFGRPPMPPLLIGLVVAALMAHTGLVWIESERELRLLFLACSYAVFRLATSWVLVQAGTTRLWGAALAVALFMALDGLLSVLRVTQLMGDGLPWFGIGPSLAQDLNWMLLLASTLSSAVLVLVSSLLETADKYREEAAGLRSILDAMPDLLFEIGPDGRYKSFHTPDPGLLAVSPDKIVGRRPEELLPEPLCQLQRRVMTEVDQHGRSFGHEYALDLPIGQRWFELSASCKHAVQPGKPPSYIFLARDVSARKQTESQLEYRTILLDHLFVSAPVGLCLTRFENRRFVQTNAAYRAICGYSIEELDRLTTADLMPPADREIPEQLRRELADNRQFGPTDIRLLCRDHSIKSVRLTAFLVLGPTGEELVWNLVEDLTASRRLERLQQEFLSNITHELRTPLTAISGALELMTQDAVKNDHAQSERLLAMARRNLRRFDGLIGDLLDMEQIVSNQLGVVLRDQPLAPLITIAMKINQPAGKSSRVRSTVSPDDEHLQARVDSDRLVQALSSLISNAMKFSPDDAPVTVSLVRQGRIVCITVTDTGVGVPEAFRPYLFDPFAQADGGSNRHRQGSGLGLPIARELIERMGGRIGYSPGPDNVGSRFHIELPISKAG
ncbi:MAG: PAS domain-containing protein [Wenzhouxiangella sp.]|nr:PAS domain-containing protein [Wenzhouxiangella sp.]